MVPSCFVYDCGFVELHQKRVFYMSWVEYCFYSSFLRCGLFKNRRTEKLNFCNDHKTELIK